MSDRWHRVNGADGRARAGAEGALRKLIRRRRRGNSVAILRGNASEIRALALAESATKGVDSRHDSSDAPAAAFLGAGFSSAFLSSKACFFSS